VYIQPSFFIIGKAEGRGSAEMRIASRAAAGRLGQGLWRPNRHRTVFSLYAFSRLCDFAVRYLLGV